MVLHSPSSAYPEGGSQILWEDGERVVRRGWRPDHEGKRRAVLLVSPAAEHPSRSNLDRLSHEYGLKDELDAAWAARPVELIRGSGQAMLVLEDEGGEPVDRLLGIPMEVGRFLRIAIDVAFALGRLHQRGLVHKDIKPANILFNKVTGAVRLTGFGIVSRLSRQRQLAEPPETLAGTLAYMAPEQTGRMNRSIDFRSDLYALGITLYQMVTGAMPFTASDPMEWVHCHIARTPATPRERSEHVPAPVSAIIMKLVAKTAEERYQTAGGVERDLRRCLSEWEARGFIDDFMLGQQDTPDRLLLPERLYGREHEVAALLASFNRVVESGDPELVLISGYSGIGKSSVVHELHRVLVPRRGLFAVGKFDEHKRGIPYATLAQAFQTLVRSLLGKSETELSVWRDALLEALGPNGRLIVDVIPELKLILGEQPTVPELAPQDAQRRFQLVFQRFIGVFARQQHPLVLFLDDLQWLDAATVDLLENLLTRSDLQYLLLLGAYRDNEVNAVHPLMGKLDAIKAAGANVTEITLAPLAHEHLGELIAHALYCSPGRAAPLAQLLHHKTGGNPFFAIQFLSSLAEERMLGFDYDQACWSWDLDRIYAREYTDNVVELMAGKLTRLPTETQKALLQLACLGNVAEITTLSIVLETSEEQVHADLWPAHRQELVERVAGTYRFVHDRIQEAAYSLIPEELRGEAHLRTGRLLAAHTPPERHEELVFDIVSQLNRGATLIASQDEREEVAKMNLIAGRRAKASIAFAAALNYLISGAAMLSEDSWERRHELIFELELHRAECEFLTGALVEAKHRLTALSGRASNIVQRATVARLLIDLYATLGQSDQAVAVGLEYLRHVQITWSPHPTDREVQSEYHRIWSQLGSRRIEELIDLPLMSNSESLATLNVLTKLHSPAFFTDANLACLTICTAVNLSLERGNCDGSTVAYLRLGMMAGPRFGNYDAGFRFGLLGYQLVEQRGLRGFQAAVCMLFASHLVPWTQHMRNGRDLLRRAFQIATRTGDLTTAAWACSRLNLNLLAAGEPLIEVEREVRIGLEFASKLKFGFVIELMKIQLAGIRTLRGLTRQFGCFDDQEFDESQIELRFSHNPNLALPESRYWIRKLQVRFLAGDYPAALDAASRAERLLWTQALHLEAAEYHLYVALSHAAAHDGAPKDRQRAHLDAMLTHLRQIETWAENCAENFENWAALIGAELARVESRDVDAMRLYERAIGSARANGFAHNEALAYELAARFYAARGFQEIAALYFAGAKRNYLRWGADGKVWQLVQLHPWLNQDQRAPAPTGTIEAPVEHLDLATIIGVSQALSGEMVLEKLIDRLMRTAIEYAGAERGMLIGQQGDELQIDAEAIASGEEIAVQVREGSARIAAALPESLIRYSMRTQEAVILDDASTQNPFSADPYVGPGRVRSILCLPLITQGKLTGILYLENTLAPRVFTPDRVTVLKVIASQAAISLENSRLYRDLEDREGKIRRLVDANIVGIFVADFKGQIIEANDAFLDMLGYDREDLIASQMHWTRLSPPEWHERDRRTLAEYRSTGIVQPFEKEYLRKDGSRVPVLIGGALLKEGGNETVAFVLNLTERKQAEQALRESEYKLRQIVDAVPGIVWSADPNGNLTHVNRRLLDNSGMRFEDFMHTGWERAYMHPADLEDATERYRRAIRTGNSYDVVLRLRRADGEFRWHRTFCEPLRDREGRIVQWYGLSIDVDEAKRAEDQLRRSEAWLTQAQGLSHTGTWVFNPATVDYSYWSDENYRIWGFDPLRGVPNRDEVWNRIHPDDRSRVWEEVQAAIRQKEELTIEYRIVLPDGTVKHLETIYHMFSSLGAPGEVFMTTIDVTQRRLAQDERDRLLQLESEIAHMNRVSVMGELAASLSHEITQPIASARNNARAAQNYLKMQPPDFAEVSEALACIVGDADRAGNIVERIREHIRKAPPRKDRFDLNAAINEVIVLASGTIVRNGVSVQTGLANGLSLVQGDRVQLQQVLLNLVLNAAEAMGSIEGARELLISTEQDGAGVLVSVRDSGPGIAPAHLDRVFDAFYTTKPSGTGMGLSICRSIIHAHEGKLWAAANEPRGAVFQFTLPGADSS